MTHRTLAPACPPLSGELLSALSVLRRAHRYSFETSGRRWEFAVEIQRLIELGLDRNDLRWLVRKQYVEHAREVTQLGDDGRHFRPTGDLAFTRRTCFILAEAGIAFAESLFLQRPAENSTNGDGDAALHEAPDALPNWDADVRELTVSGRMVKRFKWQAVNQEIVLSTFQEDGWPAVIDDPLPPKPELDSKRRLHDTIKALNRNQERPLLRFHGNGTGEGIRWELIEAEDNRR